MKIHLDTDFGGDPDDACALAMLVGWEGVELVGITTNLDTDGSRAGCVAHYLGLADRYDIPVVAGAGASLTTRKKFQSTVLDDRYWPQRITPLPAQAGAALGLLESSIEQGATIVAIGAFTNLALLEVGRSGILQDAPLVVMGGWIDPPAEGLPPWGPEMDWNVQVDSMAAKIVVEAAHDLTLVTLPVTLKAQLKASDLPRLNASGPIGGLLARQSETHSKDKNMAKLARSHPGLADDLLNFHYDPVTGAVAAGWSGAEIKETSLRTEEREGELRFHRDDDGRVIPVVVDLDAADFGERWLKCIEAADRR